ncbi:hypothetical protein TWF225_005864 [Orbilia oligospora]|uniref:Uncharacterized protein n=1 Tax=Orbilia oligospora TaxID=2813651 RepID=A0A7C8P4Q0_ORBOL|nr:hypothetical protein TWF751_005650 [Orbilia oligospora]KAF3184965.1 hypothetical protein TWF225_005864 [Orbilia oligospora]KAF3271200.1 hypothetical protein TWF217_005610 [Orbilia oligospora]KAF3271751.1 hypothetical protein TWF128_000296 [Orbilia oligospora]KAF3293660.1 hypothetical protein TWF132_004619 [Orbilia oligospora]
MAGAVEWSRNAADADSEQFAVEAQLRFSQQSDPDGLLKVPRHYIPVFVLHMFCKSERSRPFVLPDSERVAKIKAQLTAQRKLTSTCPSWQLVSKGNEILDDETFIIFDTRSKRFDKRHWSECFKYDEPYQKFFEKFTMKEFTREGWKFQKFEKLQRVDQGIMTGMWTNAYKVYDAMDARRQESSDIIRLKRSDVWDFRKYLFLMTFLRNRDRNTHLLQTSEAMGEAKEKRTAFMAVHNLNHPRDLWLHNAAVILDTPHHQISYNKFLFDLDQEDYRTNARERFMVFWEAGPNDEFILTDNSFGGMEIGRLEAKHTMPKRLKPSDLQKRLYSRDYMWHQIFVLSPKLAVALCHGTMINQSLAHQHRDRYGLRPSLLDRLPHPLPQGYYKDMHLKECKFLKPEWKIPDEVEDLFGRPADKGKFVANLEAKANSELEFMVSTLSSAQVALVNMVLLQNQSISTAVDKVVYRNPAALYRAIEEYGKHDWPIFMDEKQHSYKSLKKKIYNQFNKPGSGNESSRSSSGSSDQGTRSSGSSSTRRSEKKVVFEERKKPTPEPPKPTKKPESANPFMSDSESSDDDDDDDLAFPSSTHEPVLRSRSPSPIRRTESPVKKQEPVAPPKPAEIKIEIEPVKPTLAAVTPPVTSEYPSQRATPSPRPTPSPEPPKSVAPPLPPPTAAVEAAAEKAIAEKLEKVKAEELGRFEKEMAEKERVLEEEMAQKERILMKETEAIEKLRRERLQLEAEIEQKRRDELEAVRMQRQKSERSGRPDERGDDRIRAASTKSAETRRRPRSKDRAEAELVDVGKQLALLEVEREKMRKEKLELEEMQHRRRREEEKENQKKFDRMAKDLAMLQRQLEVYETQLEEERHEKEMVRRMAAQQKEKADALTRQTRELLEAQERDQTRAEVERAARVEKDRLEKVEKEKRELEKAKEREQKKRQERERIMNEKAEQERLQRERDMQLEREREAERAKRHREREQEKAVRAKNRQSRYEAHERGSDLSDEVDPQALFRKNRMILGALSPTSDPGMHLQYNEMTPPSSSHSHPDQFDDRRFEREMRSQSPPGYQYPPSPRRVETSPVPLTTNHRRGTQPKLLALEYESPPSSGFQTSPDSPNPPLDLALYAPPKEKASRRKADPRDRDTNRDMHPHAHGRAPQPQVRRFEPPAPLPNFNDLDRRMSKIPTHLPDYATIHNGDRYPEDEYDEEDYGNGYGDAMVRFDRTPKKRLQIEPPPAIKPQYQTRQKPPPRALPPPDYRNGR